MGGEGWGGGSVERHQMAALPLVAPERQAPPRLNDKCRGLSYFKNGKYHRYESELRIQPICSSAHELFLILTLVIVRCSDAVFLYSQSR